MNRKLILVPILFILWLFVPSANQPVLAAGVVGTGTPASCTEAALDSALAGGGLVTFNCGGAPTTISISSTKVITANTTIDASGPVIRFDGGNVVRVLQVNSGATLTVTGLVIQAGNSGSSPGGAIRNDGNLVVYNSFFNVNHGLHGGAIGNYGTLTLANTFFNLNSATINGGAVDSTGILTASNNYFYDNQAGFRGGGINNYLGTMALDGGNVARNNAGAYGGGITNDAGAMTVSNMSIFSNTANGTGGGIRNNGPATLSANEIYSNTAVNGGGGIANDGPLTLNGGAIYSNMTVAGGGISNTNVLTIYGSTLSRNQASGDGGGINNDVNGRVTVNAGHFLSNTANAKGGGLYNNGGLVLNNTTYSGNTALDRGGGIFNNALLTATQSSFVGNAAVFSGGFTGKGGGILNYGNLAILTSTFSLNQGIEGGGLNNFGKTSILGSTFSNNGVSTGFGNGGAIFTYANLDIVNSTFSGNVAYHGGAFFWFNGFTTILNSTFLSNTVGSSGGNIFMGGVYPNNVQVKNSIIAFGSPNNCDVAGITSQGYNLESTNTCGLAGAGDIINTDPKVGPLQINGGSTATHALLAGSPAIDTGTNSGCPARDQRGLKRPQRLRCDIGAVEASGTLWLPLLMR
ncbi:MAG TPA: choice-of-anchor Q domain-containing protein [Anaerolineae bacterium]